MLQTLYAFKLKFVLCFLAEGAILIQHSFISGGNLTPSVISMNPHCPYGRIA